MTSSAQADSMRQRAGAASLAEGATAAKVANASARNVPLDFTKGALVLIMVLYHWLNYFTSSGGVDYRYLRFLPPSFICITGFLISCIYLARYRDADQRLFRRLIVRGFKLLALFVALNMIVGGFTSGKGFAGYSRLLFAPANLFSVFVTGNMASERIVAFYILVPIAYLLIASAFLAILSRLYKYVFPFVTALCFTAILIFANSGQSIQNLDLIAIGLLGASIGYIPIASIERAAARPVPILCAYLCYLGAITAFNTPYFLEAAGVVLTLLLLYCLGRITENHGPLPDPIVFLGRYSLFGYIAQIAILRFLHAVLGATGVAGAALALVAGTGLTVLVVWGLDRARSRNRHIDKLYSIVFA